MICKKCSLCKRYLVGLAAGGPSGKTEPVIIVKCICAATRKRVKEDHQCDCEGKE